jgi:hypothetical protein
MPKGDYDMFHALCERHDTEHPLITLAACAALLALGAALLWGAWHLWQGSESVAEYLDDHGNRSDGAQTRAVAWELIAFLAIAGACSLAGAAAWTPKALRALVRGERVRKTG